MPKAKVPKVLSMRDSRIRESNKKNLTTTDNKKVKQKLKKKHEAARKIERQRKAAEAIPSTVMFFHYNQQLGPPFRIICDTNFINFSIKNKLDIIPAMTDCLLAKCIPYVTECIIAELQKLGAKYRIALKLVKQSFEVLPCSHKGTYADDCIVDRINHHKCYIVGTCDQNLKRRIRKIPGVPIMFIVKRKYFIERMPDALGIEPV
ncbi:FCF1 rRNA-processing protein Bka [Brevipalpus obovatus]|uniref:FCF1 rRNA-processing protein Bka n=1 Tax=Brevipalpus obovatus TaxID=246614 RepID=UPI003D9F6477